MFDTNYCYQMFSVSPGTGNNIANENLTGCMYFMVRKQNCLFNNLTSNHLKAYVNINVIKYKISVNRASDF